MTDNNTFVPPGHPIHTYLVEADHIRELLTALGETSPKADFQKFCSIFNQLAAIEKRFARKENQLFPFLEKNGVDGPSKNMWSFHDTLRDIVRLIRKNIEETDAVSADLNATYLCTAIQRLLNAEEQILFPNALELLSDKEWCIMREGEGEIGWMLPDAPPPYPENRESIEIRDTPVHKAGHYNQQQHYDEGFMTVDQVNLIFRTMPLDITYVDENDRVIFYNRGEERVFPRSPGVIGREVKFCHPPKSVGTVLQILAAFRSGERDESSFWIRHKARLIYIRYFAVRDQLKNYRGVLEISQDITEIKAIEGERRLLQWE